MSDVSSLVDVSGGGDASFNDTVTETFEVQYTDRPLNWYSALLRAQAAAGDTVPARRTQYNTSGLIDLYSDRYQGQARGEDKTFWTWTVTYVTPPPGELLIFSTANPLDRAAVYDVRYLEREYVIKLARNVEALSHGDGKGGNRPAGTLGPITNAAGKPPDEPLVGTERLEVLVVRKNYANLSDITALNRTYKRTTNSDGLLDYQSRELRYLLTESEGVRRENGVTFYPAVTTILAEDSTDTTIDNVGYDFWDAGASDWREATVQDSQGNSVRAAEPINLKLDGDKGGDTTTSITYRHLQETSYASLLV